MVQPFSSGVNTAVKVNGSVIYSQYDARRRGDPWVDNAFLTQEPCFVTGAVLRPSLPLQPDGSDKAAVPTDAFSFVDAGLWLT
jgi:hypothetical protein